MMDTVLNLGLNDTSVKGLAKQTGNDRFARDSYRRFVQMFGKIVLGVPGDRFEEALHDVVEAKGRRQRDRAVGRGPGRRRRDVQGHRLRGDRRGLPPGPRRPAGRAPSRPCSGPGTDAGPGTTGGMEGIPDDLGTAVNVQTMVFGNMGEDSGTGVAFTRNPATGERAPYGDFLTNAQGEDVVAGIRVTEPLDAMASRFGECHDAAAGRSWPTLENHYRDMCDIEFTIEQGTLYMLQTRVGKRTAAAALRMAAEMVDEGMIEPRGGGAAGRAGPARPAAPPPVRPQGRRTRAGQGSQRLARRGGGRGVLHRRRRRGARAGGREGHPGPPRDLARTTSTA